MNAKYTCLTKKINSEQAVKLKKQAKFDALKKEHTKILLENRKYKKVIRQLNKLLGEVNEL